MFRVQWLGSNQNRWGEETSTLAGADDASSGDWWWLTKGMTFIVMRLFMYSMYAGPVVASEVTGSAH